MNDVIDELNNADRAELEEEQARLRTAELLQIRPGLWSFGPYHIVRGTGWRVPAFPHQFYFTTLAQAANHILAQVF